MVFKGQYDWEWGGLEGALCDGFNHFLQNDQKQRNVFSEQSQSHHREAAKQNEINTRRAQKKKHAELWQLSQNVIFFFVS